jgi:hypothetical protein
METSGPAAGDVAKADGVPGGVLGGVSCGVFAAPGDASGGLAVPSRHGATAASTPRDVAFRNRLRDVFKAGAI